MRWTTGFVFAFTFTAPALAPAAVITQNLGFDTSTPIVSTNGTNVSPLVFNAFDTNLGTLDRVDILITGNLLLNVTSPASLAGSPPPPYAFGLTSELEFGGFGFLINPSVIANGANNGAAMAHGFNFGYTFTASLDAMSDSLGIAAVGTSSLLTSTELTVNEVRPPFMSLSRAALSANAPGIPFIVLPQLSVSGFSSSAVAPSGSANSRGNISVTYDYTPRAVAMPEPNSMALVALGVIAALRIPKRRRTWLSGREALQEAAGSRATS